MAVIDHGNSPIATKGEAVSAYLEYANEYSYTHIIGGYFKNVVEKRWFVDTIDEVDQFYRNNMPIFETIFNNITFDFANIYNPLLNNFVSIFRRACTEDASVYDIYAEDMQSYNNALEGIDFWFGLIE